MSLGRHYQPLAFLSAAVLGGVLGGLVVLAFIISAGLGTAQTDGTRLSATPGMDILDDHTCPVGHNKLLLIAGVEDGFYRDEDEPAIIRPELLSIAHYNDTYHERSYIKGFRNFDEGGRDSHLITYFDFPPKLTAASL